MLSYSFNGPNLSWEDRVGIYLEDHYYNHTDAAVVFKRVDQWTGEARYIYHGNDGTSMPWNDTAQLNYLIPEVREAVIQTILHVARKFPIIRFDAAMTLAKRHYHRLWFPEPGGGGDIASRAEHGLTNEQFDQAFPEEFWRMVVDRVAQEAPDTLLLAEAFWLMEGYFVRTLGMHRVYNSAFMNMMPDEKNQEYRLVIKNTQEFDTEIFREAGLERFIYRGPVTSPFPTLREMVDADERPVVCGENATAGVCPGTTPTFETIQETPYTFHSPDEFSCRANRGGTSGPLFQINHWIETTPTPKPSNAAIVNARDVLLSRARRCQQERGKLPNILAVDFAETGDVVGVASELNGPLTARAPSETIAR